MCPINFLVFPLVFCKRKQILKYTYSYIIKMTLNYWERKGVYSLYEGREINTIKNVFICAELRISYHVRVTRFVIFFKKINHLHPFQRNTFSKDSESLLDSEYQH